MKSFWLGLGRPLRTLVAACLLAAAASAVGLAVHGRYVLAGVPPPRAAGEQDVDLARAKALFEGGQTLFLDARSAEDFAKGHVMGALNVPAEEFDKVFPAMAPRIPRDRGVVTYCSGADCELSRVLADKLREQGYGDVKVFFGGWPQWVQAGYPSARGAE